MKQTAVRADALVPRDAPEWLRMVLRRQEDVNTMNRRLNLMNFASKMWLNHRIVGLERQVDQGRGVAAALQRTCDAHRDRIAELESQTQTLDLRANEAEDAQAELQTALQEQTEAIETELRRQEQILAEHNRAMESQQDMIERLRGLCSRQDLAIDGAILLVGIWLSSITLLRLPMMMMSRVVSKKPAHRTW